MKKLLIYIPSYNRYDLLVQQLTALTQAIEADRIRNISISVSDNASPDERYFHLASIFPQNYLSVSRHDVNIGLVGNLIHGFEKSGWDYIWLLSDDDEVSPNALSIISQEIDTGAHDFYYLKCNIKGDKNVQAGEIISSQNDYFRKFTTLSMMGLMSANIYSARIKGHIEYMYLYGYTLFPFLAGVFRVMNTEQFSLKSIGGNLLEWKQNRVSYSHIYEMALTNVLFLAELIEDKYNRNLFVSKHVSDFGISHFFPYAIKNQYNFKKAWTQIGLSRLFFSGACYLGWQILRLAKYLFPKTYDWYRNLMVGKNE